MGAGLDGRDGSRRLGIWWELGRGFSLNESRGECGSCFVELGIGYLVPRLTSGQLSLSLVGSEDADGKSEGLRESLEVLLNRFSIRPLQLSKSLPL